MARQKAAREAREAALRRAAELRAAIAAAREAAATRIQRHTRGWSARRMVRAYRWSCRVQQAEKQWAACQEYHRQRIASRRIINFLFLYAAMQPRAQPLQ